MARGGFNNALAGGSIDDFLRQLRGQAGQQPPGYPVPDGGGVARRVPRPPGHPRFPGDIGDGPRPGKSGPFIPGGIPDQRGRPDGERIEGSPYGRSGPFVPTGGSSNGRTPTTGGVMPAPRASQAQGRGGSGNPVNVMPYKDAPPPPAPEPQAQPDPEPEKKDPPPGSDDAFNAIPENPTARPPGYNARHNPQNNDQNQNQPPPSGEEQPPPQDDVQGGQAAIQNWDNFYANNPDVQWMRDKGMSAEQAARWTAQNSTNPDVKAAAQRYVAALDALGGGGQGQPPPGGGEQPPPGQNQSGDPFANWESFYNNDPNLQWMRDQQGMDPLRAAKWTAQNSTDPAVRAAAQSYVDSVLASGGGAGQGDYGTGAERSWQEQIQRARAALPQWILERMSAEDALNFATKRPDSKIAGMLREAGVLQ